jgi:integrase
MARRASVRYWPTRNAYCCWWQKKQVVLAEGPDDAPHGPTYTAAVRKFANLVVLGTADTAKDDNTVRVVCELYLRHVAASLAPATLLLRTKFLRAFTDALGESRIGSLTRHQVNTWLDLMRQPRTNPATGKTLRWSSTTAHAAVGVILTAFRWAVEEGLITRQPLVGMKKPKAKSRGREALIGRNPEERAANHQRILDATSPAFRTFIICLEATGCRPGELANATAHDFNADIGAIVYHADDNRLEHEHRHKTAGHGKDRLIFFVGESLEIVKALAKKHPK